MMRRRCFCLRPQHLSRLRGGGIDGELALRLAIAAPGGILLGILLGKIFRYIVPFVTGTLGGNLLEFVGSVGV